MERYHVQQVEATSPLHAEGLHWKIVDVWLSTRPVVAAFALRTDAVRFARLINAGV